MTRIVVFDLDDTLYPEHQFCLSGFQAAGAWLEAQHGIAGFGEAARALFEGGRRLKVFDAALERLGRAPDPGLVEQLVRAYREHMPTLTLHDDARWALDHFKRRGPLGLITDGYLATQRNKVSALGIAPYFNALVFSDELGRECWKPSPAPYRRCMEALACAGPECTYVADNPAKDFVAAKVLGWNTIQITRDRGEYAKVVAEDTHRAHHHIRSLLELEDLIR